jgi:NAD(P)-dependent dehydrogenase (short-subunit alcohol dehydrogenase family)
VTPTEPSEPSEPTESEPSEATQRSQPSEPTQPSESTQPSEPSQPSELFDLTGRVALVTGGSRGLGREMVLGFARAGADVVIASRKLEACQKVAREVEELTGRQALPHACHVGHWDELPGLVDAAYERFGHVDVLVNNAGMSPLYDDVATVSERLWDSVLNVNLKGPFRLSALVGPRMIEAGRGSIINVSTTGSIRPAPDIVPYASAKAGLNAMTQALAQAFGPTVRVNCLMPGPFFTDVSRFWDLEQAERGFRRHALQRGGQPPEIVGAALFLASDASSFTTAAVLRVDGGIP